jgi:hypothetical protein
MKTVVRIALALALLAPTLSACDNGDLPPATKFSSFSGTITDAATHKPIANATIVVDTVLTATTDDTGTFKIDKVPSGIVDYVIKADGYADLTSSTNAEPGKPLSITAEMQRPPAP